MVTSSYVNVPPIETFSPTNKLFAIPTPPDTINAPVETDVDVVVLVIVTIPEEVTLAASIYVVTAVAATPLKELPSPTKLVAVITPAFPN